MGFTKWFQNIRRKVLGLAEIEASIIAKTSFTNQAIEEVNQTVSKINQSVEEVQYEFRQEVKQSFEELSQALEILAEPQNLIPRLNDYTGKFYACFDYPPSRDYRPRWRENNPHQGLVALFQKDLDQYYERCCQLVKLKPFFDKINKYSDPQNPSEPRWLKEVPINAIDSALLYYFMVELKPKIYLEIGSGVTTLFAARAKRDHQLQTQIISIDPEPRTAVDAVCDEVIRDALEMTDLSIFSQLEPGDIVFMDGSHRCFMNSDVTVFMLEVVPQLKPGVVIHIHDIVLPYDYHEMFSDWYWNEQYILAAYLLAAQEKVKILMPSKFVSETPEFKQIIEPILQDWDGPDDRWLNGGSLWFTHTKVI